MKLKLMTIAVTIVLSISIYAQARESEILTFNVYQNEGDVSYTYLLDKRLCNCFFQAENKTSKSISITQVSCEKLSRFYNFKESYSKCLGQ